MRHYEVIYEIDGEARTEVVAAENPVDAQERFLAAGDREGVLVLCVVRQ